MCGDGANDCGALKSAHAGLSLSEAEASVASPFTSKQANISCIPTLIREGRTALVTSFGVFKYMAAYSLTQFISVMILYSVGSNLTDFQFLYIDLFLITIFAFFFGRTKSYKGPLASTPPPSSLISLAPILSILLHIFVIIGFQTFAFFHVQKQDWFVPFNSSMAEESVGCYENYAVYSVSQFQYIILAVIFSKGPPYRQRIYTNYFLIGSILTMTAISAWLTLSPPDDLATIMEIITSPSEESLFRWQLIFMAIVNSALAVFIELVIIDLLLHKKLRGKFTKMETSKKKYLAIEHSMELDHQWPLGTNASFENSQQHQQLNARNLYSSSQKPQNEVISIVQYHSSL